MPYRDPISGMVFYTKHEVDALMGNGGGTALSGTKTESVLVPSWTASGGDYYYDLVHGKSRPVYVIAYDTHTGKEYPIDKETVSGNLNTVRIWFTGSDPGNSRICLYYF